MTAWRLWAGTGLAVLLCPLHGFAAAAAEGDGDPGGTPVARPDAIARPDGTARPDRTVAVVAPGRVRVSTGGPAGGTCVAVDERSRAGGGWSLGQGVLVYHRPRPAAATAPSRPAASAASATSTASALSVPGVSTRLSDSWHPAVAGATDAAWRTPASQGPAVAEPAPCAAPVADAPVADAPAPIPAPLPPVPSPAGPPEPPVPPEAPAPPEPGTDGVVDVGVAPGRVTVNVSGPEGSVCAAVGEGPAVGACRPGAGPDTPSVVVGVPAPVVPPRVPARVPPEPPAPEPLPAEPDPAPEPVPARALPGVPAPGVPAPAVSAPAVSAPAVRPEARPARELWRPYYRSVALQRHGPDGLSTVMLMVVVTTPAVLAAAALRPRSKSRGA